MANVSVLLHSGDRKKVVKLPSGCTDHYALLCQTILEWTGKTVEFLERFDSDWDDWVEVEKDFRAGDKDRIKAVVSKPAEEEVTPAISNVDRPLEENTQTDDSELVQNDVVDLLSESNSTETDDSECVKNDVDLLSGSNSTEESETDEEEELTFEEKRQRNIAELEQFRRKLGLFPSTPSRGKGRKKEPRSLPPSSVNAATSSTSSKPTTSGIKSEIKTEGPIAYKRVLKRERTADKHLPNPFPLPQHFTATVEAGLIAQNPGIISKYLSRVANTMLDFKVYPTREEYGQVAVEIVNKYGWMKSKLGPPTGAIVTGLQNRFKEFRRDRKVAKPDDKGENTPAKTKKISPVQKSPSISWMQPPPIPEGEDACSFDRFSSLLRDEARRKKKRNEVVSKLMETTYAQRRTNILEFPGDIPELITKYPFLGVEDELLNDLERIAGVKGLTIDIMSSWKDTWAPKIMKLNGGGQKSSEIFAKYNPENPDSLSLAALCTLCCVARDSRTKASYENVVHFVPGKCDPQQVAGKLHQPQPLLVIEGDIENPEGCYLMAEGTSILRGQLKNAVALLLATFFVFNIQYTPGLNNFYTVLEILLLHQIPKKCPITVSNVLSQLNYEL